MERVGIFIRVINYKLYKNCVEFDSVIDLVFEEFFIDIVCFVGFMRIFFGFFV